MKSRIASIFQEISLVHHRGDRRSEMMGQEIRDPDEPGPAVVVGEDLRRRVVMGHLPADHRPGEPACLVVEIHDDLARDEPVAERDDARAIFELDVGHEAGRETPVQRTDVPQRIPRHVRLCVYQNLAMD
jgi:hypothetical protein